MHGEIPPTLAAPRRTNGSIPSLSEGEIGTRMRICADTSMTRSDTRKSLVAGDASMRSRRAVHPSCAGPVIPPHERRRNNKKGRLPRPSRQGASEKVGASAGQADENNAPWEAVGAAQFSRNDCANRTEAQLSCSKCEANSQRATALATFLATIAPFGTGRPTPPGGAAKLRALHPDHKKA
jgi:hypothetical protein